MKLIESTLSIPISLDAHSVRATWSESRLCDDLGPYDKGRVALALGPEDAAVVAGDISEINPLVCMSLQPLRVKPEYRRRGAATRLISALAHMAIRRGVDTLNVSAESAHTLRILSRLFCENTMTYFDPYNNGTWDISTNEAIHFLQDKPSQAARDACPVTLDIDLRNLNATSFEVPFYCDTDELV